MMPPWERLPLQVRQAFISDLRLFQYVATEQERRAKNVYENLRMRLSGYQREPMREEPYYATGQPVPYKNYDGWEKE